LDHAEGKEREKSQVSDRKPEKKPENLAKPSSTDKAMADTIPSSGEEDFDLRPPQRKPRSTSLETLSELLFSEGYLSTLTSDPQLLARFTAFLKRYKPEASHLVIRYLETQKVIKAIEYGNAVAATLVNDNEGKENSCPAAQLSSAFLESSRDAFSTLVTTALPAWVTYSLVKTATACLTAEITSHSTPLTRDLVGGLSEVFCLTDPTQEDNPIVYSSEEFYRLTGYDKDSVIGQNCRFLQGPKTKRESVQRLRKAINGGEEICETLLNYRRDGKPFVNVLMLAPLLDDKGKVKYYLGAQVDASRLVEGGRGVDGYERFLVKREMESERGRKKETNKKQMALAKLRDLSMTFDLEESAVVQSNSRSSSMTRGEDREGSVASTDRPRTGRRVLRDEDEKSGSEAEDDDKDNPAWKLSHDKPSGGLPGVYKKYLLLRPYPSLRIIFVSQAVRRMGRLQQRPFLAHVAAPSSTLSGLRGSLESGEPVTAKIAIMAQAGKARDGTVAGRWGRRGKEDNGGEDPGKLGKPCWISATPLLDSDNNVGVWMVVIVDKTDVASHTGRTMDATAFNDAGMPKPEIADLMAERSGLNLSDLPIKPKAVGILEEYRRLPNNDADSGVHFDGGLKDKEADEGGDEDALAKERDEQQKSKRSERVRTGEGNGDEAYTDAANYDPIESPNGSPVPEITNEHTLERGEDGKGEVDGPRTPTLENLDLHLETAPRPNESYSARQVGLHAMEALARNSPINTRQVNGVGADDASDADLAIASPYSVD
jgi:PAS domain S-box-containing protein